MKKNILICCFLAIFSMLMIPNISAVEYTAVESAVEEKIRDIRSIDVLQPPGLDLISLILLIIFAVIGAVSGVMFGIAGVVEAIMSAIVAFFTNAASTGGIVAIIFGALGVLASLIHTIISALSGELEGFNKVVNAILKDLQQNLES